MNLDHDAHARSRRHHGADDWLSAPVTANPDADAHPWDPSPSSTLDSQNPWTR